MVRVGDSLLYPFGENVNIYGQEMNVKLFLGNAFKFAVYDALTNTFKV